MSTWTDAHSATLQAFARAFPPPAGPGQDDACRAWTRRLAEQFAFEFPAEGWGHKSGDPTRPPSTDVIATRRPFVGFDVIGNQGTEGWTLIANPGRIDLTGQTFIEVTPVDHLGTGGSSGGGTPTPPPAAGLAADQVRAVVRAELLRVESELAWVRGCLQETTRALGEMRALLEQQDRRREELAVHVDQVIVERTKGWEFKGNARLIGTISGRVGE